MTTETRSVAEIAELMGWRFGLGGVSVPGEDAHRPAGSTPTPDDVLAWLSEHVRDSEWNTEGDISILYQSDDGLPYVEVQWYCAAGVELVSGDTLDAALEAAVRAVAGEAGE